MEGAGLRFMLMAFAAWLRGQQQDAVAYLIEDTGSFVGGACS